MANKKKTEEYASNGRDRLLPKYSLFIFDRSRTAAILWLFLAVFGVLSYTTWLKRQGFPSVNVPFSIISGAYVVSDAAKVDNDVASPIDQLLLKDSRVSDVQSQSEANVYSVIVQYKDGTDAILASKQLQQTISSKHILPAQASLAVQTPKFGFTARGDDAVVSVYAQHTVTTQQLVTEGRALAAYLQARHLASVQAVSIIDPFVAGVNPLTGQAVATQTKFDRYGERSNNKNTFYPAISVGVTQKSDTDVIKFDTDLRTAVEAYNNQHAASGYLASVSASYAPDIKQQIGELQRALLEGLIAVLVIGSLIIAIRASVITVISMLTVICITLGVLYLIGYTLNTITLFSLILCLGLMVDDTIIMIEAIDAQRRKHHDPRETVHVATRKISRAMVAATSTAMLSFSPLLFVGGILGGFIRAIPVTVITSLLVSLVVALTFIPLFARYLLLGKKQMGPKQVHEPAASMEARIAQFIGRPMLWARGSTKRLFGVGAVAMVIGVVFIGAAGVLFQKVTFNIFPPSKDTNGLTVALSFNPGTTIQQAETVADRADTIVAQSLGNNFQTAAYYENAGPTTANLSIYITPYQSRSVTSPSLVKQVQQKFQNFTGAAVKVGQQDVGPPPGAFTVNIETTDRSKAQLLARDLRSFLAGRTLTRVSGTTAKITTTSISDPGTYQRTNDKLFMSVTANFGATDTTTLVELAKTAVNDTFTPAKLASYGLPKDVLQYNIGQEQENQNSFKTLALAFPAVLVAIYILLVIEFRSLAQPLLIFMAIPFSLFGITLGLYLTNNAFSFFAMLGFFALIGLSIKNTILLTDYANQLRRDGAGAIDAAVGALSERFRPLIATSLTAVCSLIPLTLSSPFWQGLTVVLIFGLLSSTLMVVTVFPYYYLGAEYLRMHISRTAALSWLALTVVLSVGLSKVGAKPGVVPIVALLVGLAELLIARRRRVHKTA